MEPESDADFARVRGQILSFEDAPGWLAQHQFRK